MVHTLATHGVATASLYIAWDFTVDSAENITAPELTMRQQTFASLAGGVGTYLVTKVTNDPPDNPTLAREVEGYFDVPSYLSGEGGKVGSVLTVGPDGLPVHEPGHTQVANFECEIPKAATAAHPGTVGVYGHGLFNSATEVDASWVPQFSNADDYVFCGTDWMGLSSTTLPLAASVISNLSNFPSLVDNLMQSLLDAEVLGRLLDNPAGFAMSPAFEDSAHQPLLRAGKGLVYYGNSEGAIMGGAFTALSTDATRSVLGVSGMDYDILLFRSADFAPFLGPLSTSYPSRAVQQIGFDLTQMLWDRADTDGYAEQMTTTALPNTPTHEVMLEEAFGDHQVSNVTTAIEARTIGADIIEPALAKGRSNLAEPYWGIAPLKVGVAPLRADRLGLGRPGAAADRHAAVEGARPPRHDPAIATGLLEADEHVLHHGPGDRPLRARPVPRPETEGLTEPLGQVVEGDAEGAGEPVAELGEVLLDERDLAAPLGGVDPQQLDDVLLGHRRALDVDGARSPAPSRSGSRRPRRAPLTRSNTHSRTREFSP